jgi:site-specific DNA-methyltransferase (adenine-specific)
MNTKLFRMLVSINKISQDAYAKVYEDVPILDFSKSWTDAELYERYGLTEEEITFVETMIKPME